MKRVCYSGMLTLAVLLSCGASAWADEFAAIAYSPSTGKMGWSYSCGSLKEAQDTALSYCEADDAQIVSWCKNAYIALAVGDDAGAYGADWGNTQEAAEARALERCAEHTTGAYIAQCVFSGRAASRCIHD